MSPPTKLTPQEKEACIVLSTLFLDTDKNLLRNYMSLSLYEIEPEIPIPTLEKMLYFDLFPILFPNCLTAAGEWAGFDEEWLIERVEAGRSRSIFNPWRWIRGIICIFAWQIVGWIVIWPTWLKVREDIYRRRENTFQRDDSGDESDLSNSDGEEALGIRSRIRDRMWEVVLAEVADEEEE